MITTENKTTYKLQNISFNGNGNLIDEDAEIVNLLKDLRTVFADKEFTLTAVMSSKKTTNSASDFE